MSPAGKLMRRDRVFSRELAGGRRHKGVEVGRESRVLGVPVGEGCERHHWVQVRL